LLKGFFQGETEKISDGCREQPDGDQEVGFRGNPAALRIIKTPARGNDVEMRVK
jgi:hypothetical protein